MSEHCIEPELLHITSGYFWMGSHERDSNAWNIEKPYHRIYLDEYWIGRYPITNREFQCFTTANPSYQISKNVDSQNDKRDNPAVWITWHDANEYCKWLSKVAGRPYKLPSEPQWEKAARGIDGRVFPWGNLFESERLNSEEGGSCHTTPVGMFSPIGDSPYGCADMSGNVWEWTQNSALDYPCIPMNGCHQEADESHRVLRGGCFVGELKFTRCAFRLRAQPNYWSVTFGFRIVIESINKEAKL